MKFYTWVNRFALTVGLFGALGFSSTAQAALLTGVTLGCGTGAGSIPITCTPASAVVGAGVEFTFPIAAQPFSLDIDADGFVLLSYNGTATLNLNATYVVRLTDTLSGAAPFIDFNLLTATNVTGITPFDLSFTADTVSVNMGTNAVWSPNSSLRMQILEATAVPEPGSIALLSLGMAGMAIMTRRRRKS